MKEDLRVTCRMQVPLCPRHQDHWSWRAWLYWGGLAAAAFWVIVILYQYGRLENDGWTTTGSIELIPLAIWSLAAAAGLADRDSTAGDYAGVSDIEGRFPDLRGGTGARRATRQPQRELAVGSDPRPNIIRDSSPPLAHSGGIMNRLALTLAPLALGGYVVPVRAADKPLVIDVWPGKCPAKPPRSAPKSPRRRAR